MSNEMWGQKALAHFCVLHTAGLNSIIAIGYTTGINYQTTITLIASLTLSSLLKWIHLKLSNGKTHLWIIQISAIAVKSLE